MHFAPLFCFSHFASGLAFARKLKRFRSLFFRGINKMWNAHEMWKCIVSASYFVVCFAKNTREMWNVKSVWPYRLACRKFHEEHFLSQKFFSSLIELAILTKHWIWGPRTCHASSSGVAKGWELSEVVSDTYPDTFSQNLAFSPKMFFKMFFMSLQTRQCNRIIPNWPNWDLTF